MGGEESYFGWNRAYIGLLDRSSTGWTLVFGHVMPRIEMAKVFQSHFSEIEKYIVGEKGVEKDILSGV